MGEFGHASSASPPRDRSIVKKVVHELERVPCC